MSDLLSRRKHPIHLPNMLRHNEPVIVFLTVCSANRSPILANAQMHGLFVDAWLMSRQWSVGRYIIMPDHVHLFCSPASIESINVKTWAAYWKSLMSRGLRGYGPLATVDGVEAVPPLLTQNVLKESMSSPTNHKSAIWQRDVWDTQVRSSDGYHEKWEYVRMNPVRKGLIKNPDEWPFQGELSNLSW